MMFLVLFAAHTTDWEGGAIVFGALLLIAAALWLFLDGKNR